MWCQGTFALLRCFCDNCSHDIMVLAICHQCRAYILMCIREYEFINKLTNIQSSKHWCLLLKKDGNKGIGKRRVKLKDGKSRQSFTEGICIFVFLYFCISEFGILYFPDNERWCHLTVFCFICQFPLNRFEEVDWAVFHTEASACSGQL